MQIEIEIQLRIQKQISLTILEDGEDGKDGWCRLRHSCAAPALASMWVACNVLDQSGMQCIR